MAVKSRFESVAIGVTLVGLVATIAVLIATASPLRREAEREGDGS